MPPSHRSSSITEAYGALAARWRSLDENERGLLVDSFAVGFAYHSGGIENDQITLHDTREVFDRDGVSSFSGDVRTIFEISNLKAMWTWTMDTLPLGFSFDTQELLFCHKTLTNGTYDRRRWSLGERPGEFKHHMYEVADGVGDPPEEVPASIESLLAEVRDALAARNDPLGVLTVAAYLHAALVDIHPFADGNGRVARQMTNMVLLREGLPPVLVPKEDRMAYFGALDAYHYDDQIVPLKQFLAVEALKRWNDAV